jgi:hypothetical protein
LQDKIIELTPIEGQWPLGIFKDKYAEEMNFLTLFYRDPRDDDITNVLGIVQWEFCKLGDFSCHTTNLFFKTMPIIIEKVLSCLWV